MKPSETKMLKELADEAAHRRVEDAEQETVCTNIQHKDAPVQTTVRNGRIIRVRPLPVDPEEWKMWKEHLRRHAHAHPQGPPRFGGFGPPRR